MKKKGIEKYIYQMFAGFGAIALSILFFFFLFKLDVVGRYLKAAGNTLMPFILGLIMAYLIYPLSNGISLYLDKMTGDKYKKVNVINQEIRIFFVLSRGSSILMGA